MKNTLSQSKKLSLALISKASKLMPIRNEGALLIQIANLPELDAEQAAKSIYETAKNRKDSVELIEVRLVCVKGTIVNHKLNVLLTYRYDCMYCKTMNDRQFNSFSPLRKHHLMCEACYEKLCDDH